MRAELSTVAYFTLLQTDNNNATRMTGTWRDTLFVWQGRLVVVDGAKEEEEEDPSSSSTSSSSLTWTGSWVGCENCPDAASAPTPNSKAFAESKMKFQVSGSGIRSSSSSAAGGDQHDDDEEEEEENKNNQRFWKLELNQGPGWDLGDGEEKQRHTDSKHTLYMKHLPTERRRDMADDRKEYQSVVVAVGENEFGSFVSAGYILPDHDCSDNIVNYPTSMILGRRYLDDGDIRASWSVEELYKRVVETDPGGGYLSTRADNQNKYRIPPWRSPHLHAAKLTTSSRGRKSAAKRKRGETKNERSSSNEEQQRLPLLPPLNIPGGEQFSPDFTFRGRRRDSTAMPEDVKWVEQCHGCGNDMAVDPSGTCIKEVDEWTRAEPNCHIGRSYYCSEDCACKNGAPAWAKASKTYYSTPGYFLQSDSSTGFWGAVKRDKWAAKLLEEAGWTEVAESYYILESPQHY